jgi:hypothetical protein
MWRIKNSDKRYESGSGDEIAFYGKIKAGGLTKWHYIKNTQE